MGLVNRIYRTHLIIDFKYIKVHIREGNMFGAFFFKLKIEFVNFINVDFEIQKKE